MKIVIHDTIGGFGLSRQAVLWLRERGHEMALAEKLFGEEPPQYEGETEWDSYLWRIPRNDPLLIELLETHGSEFAASELGSLKVVEIPDDVNWHIGCADDGHEWVAEDHRRWW